MTLLTSDARGVYTISVTPFTEEGAIDWDSLDRVVDFYFEAGSDGLTILGMMGEAPKLTQAESRAVAERAVLLGMDVLVHDPMVDDALVVAVGARPVSWSELLTSSHFISVHVAASERTRGLLDDAAFGRMKEGVRLVNCSRGAVVNEEALLQALRTGKVAAAAMDVFESEPPFGSPLLEMPQFTATPHLVSSTFEAQIAVAEELAEQVRDFFVSGEVRGIVNPEVLEGPETESKS